MSGYPDRVLGRAIRIAAVLCIAASPVLAQQGSRVFTIDYGMVGLQSLSVLFPSQVYRPLDDISVRPGGDAQGMGGAYLARAQGPVAVGWEPAGLASLKRSSAVVDGYDVRSSSNVSGFPDSLLIQGNPILTVRSYDVKLKPGIRANFLAAGAPIWDGGNLHLVGALSWRRYADVLMPEESVTEYVTAGSSGREVPVVLSLDRTEKGAVESVAPTLALQVGPKLAVGATFNVLTGRLLSETKTRLAVGGPPYQGAERLEYKYSGIVPDFGVRLTPLNRIELAGKFTPGYSLKVKDGSFSSRGFDVPNTPVLATRGTIADYTLSIPMAVGVGIAVQATPRLWVSSDVNIHQWSKTTLKYDERPKDVASASDQSLPYRDVTSIHLGAEYLLARPSWADIPVRVGFHSTPLSYAGVSRQDVKVDTAWAPGIGALVRVVPSGDYAGKQASTKSFTFGGSIRMKTISYDLGVEALSYKSEKWYYDTPFDPLVNPRMKIVTVDRKLTRLRLSASYMF